MYQGLAPVTVAATLDNTGQNAGNWTNAFTDLPAKVPWFECYHMVLTNAPAGGSAAIWIGARQWSFVAPGFGGGSEWDPSQPMLLQPGQEVYFFWNVAASGTPPSVTMWFRYDAAMWSTAT